MPADPKLVGEIASACFQQLVGAHDVGLHEGFRSVYGTIHMAFGSQVHDHIGLMGVKNFVQRSGVTDVGQAETVVRVVVSAGQGRQISRIGEFIDVYHLNG